MSSLRTTMLLAPILVASAVVAQGPATRAGTSKLVDCVEAPLLYLSLTAGAADRPAPKAVQQLLADPAFDTLIGNRDGSPSTLPADATGRALALVRGVVARSSGDLEIALTGVLPGVGGAKGQPLLVLRARLQPAESSRLQGLLAGPVAEGAQALAAPRRRIGDLQTYDLLGADGSVEAGVGRTVEVALVGTDLVIANDATAMEELLAPDRRTSATRRVLSSEPRFQRLREQVPAQPGSLLVYGDWNRLGQRLQLDGRAAEGADNDAMAAGVPSFLLRWSGIGSARGVMLSLAGDDNDFTGTMLLDFDREEERGFAPPPPRPNGRHGDGPRPDGPRGDGPRGPGPEVRNGIDGWLACTQSVPAKTLVRDLPGGGLGGIVLAVDLQDLALRSRRGGELLHRLRESFDRQGVDFERKVLSRLGARGTAQLLFGKRGEDAVAEIASVYAIRATSKKAAEELFDDLRRAAELNGLGRLVQGRERRGAEILELQPRDARSATCIAVVDDAVLIAFDSATIDEFVEVQKRASRTRSKPDGAVAAAVQKIGGENVAGLFDLDFSPWFEHLASVLANRGVPVDLTRIPRRHIGYLDLQPRDGGLVLRVRVLSSR